LQSQIRKQRLCSRPSPASRPKSTQNNLYTPQAAEVGLAVPVPGLAELAPRFRLCSTPLNLPAPLAPLHLLPT
jgi:hypothetical protein